MYQLTMFEKSEEVVSKKNYLDKEMYKTKTIGFPVVIKVESAIVYVPIALHINPNPSYKILSIDINGKYLK